MQRYLSATSLITIPFSRCIDLSDLHDDSGNLVKISSVSRIYRSKGFVDNASTTNPNVATDPMYASQWQLLSGTGNLYNFQSYVYDYAAWNTLLQIRNTVSTDLAFRYDKASNKLYINVASNNPTNITIEYVPRYDTVDEVVSDYWIDILIKLAVAITKITLGRIRSRYVQSNALWQNDVNILQEGLDEYNALQSYLQANLQLVYPID